MGEIRGGDRCQVSGNCERQICHPEFATPDTCHLSPSLPLYTTSQVNFTVNGLLVAASLPTNVSSQTCFALPRYISPI